MRLLGYFTLLIAFVLCISCLRQVESTTLDDFMPEYEMSVHSIMKNVQITISEYEKETDKFLMHIDNLAYKFSLANNCTNFSISDLSNSFRVHTNLLTIPLQERIIDVNAKLSELHRSCNLYSIIAGNKKLNCELQSRNCSTEVDNWLEGSVKELMCKLIAECKTHNVTRRSTQGCGANQFQCKNGECISTSDVCTGIKTCRDGSDELPGCTKYCFNGFHCLNMKCVDKSKICNGRDDCLDGSDEKGCQQISSADTCNANAASYLCDNLHCTGLSKVCNGHDDCGDGSDEGGQCAKLDCESGCSSAGGVCLATPRGSVCLNKCPMGTSVTPLGCIPGPQLPPQTISELLEGVPQLIERFIHSFRLLQKRTLFALEKEASEKSVCLGNEYTILDSLYSLLPFGTNSTKQTDK